VPIVNPPISLRRLRVRLAPDRRGDRGAVAVIVALLLGSGVLLGIAALVVDVGNIYVEREQLQSGADAGVLKIAQVCATGPYGCASSALDIARRYADANSDRGSAGVSVCGRGGDLGDCPTPSGGLTDCIGAPPVSGNYVEVHTSTLLPDGSTALPPVFAQAIIGGYRGPTVVSCARAAWGTPSSANLAMTMSECEWNAYTNNGTSFPSPPVERVIYLHDETNAGACQAAGQSGGFGWLDDGKSDCRTPVVVGGTYSGDPRTSAPQGCEALLTGLSGRPVLMPLYSTVTARGDGSLTYTLAGFAAFVVTGWYLPGFDASSTLTGRSSCDGSTGCIFGYFSQATLPGGGEMGGPDFGATVTRLVG
jgi:Putative Flp pilus-assembly TadE/G-like